VRRTVARWRPPFLASRTGVAAALAVLLLGDCSPPLLLSQQPTEPAKTAVGALCADPQATWSQDDEHERRALAAHIAGPGGLPPVRVAVMWSTLALPWAAGDWDSGSVPALARIAKKSPAKLRKKWNTAEASARSSAASVSKATTDRRTQM
jgi:hypothetical protein